MFRYSQKTFRSFRFPKLHLKFRTFKNITLNILAQNWESTCVHLLCSKVKKLKICYFLITHFCLKPTMFSKIKNRFSAFTRRLPSNVATDVSDAFDPPKPKPRKNRGKPTSTFQSHVVQNWEAHSPVKDMTAEYSTLNNNDVDSTVTSKKASFKSHVDVPVANLLDL